MSVNAKLKALRGKDPRNPYGFTRMERLALFLARLAFWTGLAASVILIVRTVLNL